MSKKVSKQIPNNEIKNTKLFCKHNQNRNKTNFLINLDKIGLIFSLFQFLFNLVFMLFVIYLSGWKEKGPFGFYRVEDMIFLTIWLLIVVMALFIIKIACKIKLIKNHEPSKLNCQKIEQNIQQAIKSFKENLEIAIYLWFFIIFCTVVFVNLVFLFQNSSPKQMIFKLLTPVIVFCYFFIGLSCILFIRKSKK